MTTRRAVSAAAVLCGHPSCCLVVRSVPAIRTLAGRYLEVQSRQACRHAQVADLGASLRHYRWNRRSGLRVETRLGNRAGGYLSLPERLHSKIHIKLASDAKP